MSYRRYSLPGLRFIGGEVLSDMKTDQDFQRRNLKYNATCKAIVKISKLFVNQWITVRRLELPPIIIE